MISAWRLMCPTHNLELMSEKSIPISEDGVVNKYPLFFCKLCGCYYLHADNIVNGTVFEYGDYTAKVCDNVPHKSEPQTLILTAKNLKSYDEPFVPVTCYKDGTELKHFVDVNASIDNVNVTISGYYCDNCNDFYMESEEHDAIWDTIGLEKQSNVLLHDKRENVTGKRYSFENIAPSEYRKCNKEVQIYLNKFEDCKQNYKNDFPYSLLHYAFIFRRFDEAEKIFASLNNDEIEKALHFKGEQNSSWVTPLVCAKWNLSYIYAYDEKNGTNLVESLEPYLEEVEYIDEIGEYTDAVDKDGRTIFDLFWGDNQPILDVMFFEKQELASKQVEKNDISLVMDEVGTGKTVSALYSIKNVINACRKKNEKAKVLIVCPYNKREDWQGDIRRQLGRYAHIIDQGDDGHMYEGQLKKVFFKSNEDVIMIAGPKQGSDMEGSYTALKGSVLQFSNKEEWDLVVIDEGHISFSNYEGISARKAMILTATPIVVNAKGRRSFIDYIDLLKNITECNHSTKEINPITCYMPEEQDVYVNWFREDMGKKAAERRIRFVACKRHPDRDDIYYRIKDEIGTLAALQYDQDDEYLFDAAENRYGFPNVKKVVKNGKIDRLIDVLKENQKSYIIFCEHQFVVDLIFKRLKDEFVNDIVAEKYGKFENQSGLGNVQDGQLINTLMQALRGGKRVLFITTGKTGGTGLNLGEFDGVIHYELPFTSIELEQRFGRVDRIDTNKAYKNRDMIFMLNECKADENDMEINRMLYYCTTKIDITCQYMPIRNTVLYYPEFVKRNGQAIRDSLVYFQKEHVLSEANEKIIREIRRQRLQYEKNIRESEYWKDIQELGKTVRESVINALSIEKIDSISEEQYDYMGTYIEYLKNTKAERNEYERVYRRFLDAKKNVNYWLAIVGLLDLDDKSEVFVGYSSVEDGEQQQVIDNFEEDKEKVTKVTSVQKQIKELIEKIDECHLEGAELNSFSADGVFCFLDNMIKRSTVENYRSGKGWL